MSLDNDTPISNPSSTSNNPTSDPSSGSSSHHRGQNIVIPPPTTKLEASTTTSILSSSSPANTLGSGISILNPIISPKGGKDSEKLSKKRPHDEIDNNHEDHIIDEDEEIESDDQVGVVDTEMDDYEQSLTHSSHPHFSVKPHSSSSGNTATTTTRSKLSTQDIKIILYLIIKIKPFKYIGNRSLSQTKKWETVQLKYSEIKDHLITSTSTTTSNSSVPSSSLVVPTVRTLQRQLATAIKKAASRRQDLGTPIEKSAEKSEDYYNYEFISIDNSLSELENYVLELNELSENFKAGRLDAVSNPSAVTGTPPAAITTSSTTLPPSVAAVSSSSSSPNAPKPRDHSYLNLKEILESTSLIEPQFQSTVVDVTSRDSRDAVVEKFETLTNHISSIINSSDPNNKQLLPLAQTLQTFSSLNALVKNHEEKLQNLNESLLNDLNQVFKSYKKKLTTINSNFNQDKLNSYKSFTDFIISSLYSTDASSRHTKEVLTLLNSFKDSLK